MDEAHLSLVDERIRPPSHDPVALNSATQTLTFAFVAYPQVSSSPFHQLRVIGPKSNRANSLMVLDLRVR